MSGPWARYGEQGGTVGDQPGSASPDLLREQSAPTAELSSSVDDHGRSSYGGQVTSAVPPARARESRGSLILAVIVMLGIVIASIAILLNPSGANTVGLPAGAPSAGDSGDGGGRPTPPSGTPNAAPIGPLAGSSGTGVPRTGAPTRSPARSPAPAAATVSGAARLAATAWVAAVNERRVGPAQALSCSAVRAKITASFVATVAGSIKVVSIVKDPSTGTPTLSFSYLKTTDASRQHDHLSLVDEAGGWKVCT